MGTVLDGGNAWYNKMIFSGLSRGVSAASIKIGEDDTIQMTRNSGATWYASTPGTSGDVTVTFSLTNRCCAEGLQCYKFSEWYSQCLTSCPSGWECSGVRRRNLRGAFRK